MGVWKKTLGGGYNRDRRPGRRCTAAANGPPASPERTVERTDPGAEYLILYIWGDDHIRSLLRCRHAITYRFWDPKGGRAFHGNFWPNLEMDLQTGRFVEKDNLLPTRESLYHMTDPQWMVDHLKDDLALRLHAFSSGYIRDPDREPVNRQAARPDFAFAMTNGSGAGPAKEVRPRSDMRGWVLPTRSVSTVRAAANS